MQVKCQNSGEVLSLDQRRSIGGGGQGLVFAVREQPDIAAKIYNPSKLDDELISKLQTMVAQAPHDPMGKFGHPSIAWPIDLLREVNGRQAVVGFLMPRIHNAATFDNLYSVVTRQAFPDFSYRALCLTAFNVATAIWAIHEAGYVVGDVKDANILVRGDALITLVDTDSFQITDRASGRIHRCPVGTDLFTPPEMLDKDLSLTDRSAQQDMFGVATLFFRLLMENTLPYAGKIVGRSEAMNCSERVRIGGFPYAGLLQFLPSKLAPPFEMLHPSIQELFRQCFVAGHADPASRPDARTWARALKRCESSFVTCRVNPQHHYFDHCKLCPWCERSRLLNVDSFPARVARTPFAQSGVGSQALHNLGAQARPHQTTTAVGGPFYRPAAAPKVQPTATPIRFHASSPSISPGQPVTLHWSVPNVHSVQIINKWGRQVFDSSSAIGQVTLYPRKTETYRLIARGLGPKSSARVTVTVTQLPRPVVLRPGSVRMSEPFALHFVGSDLHLPVSLNPASLNLRKPFGLRNHFQLNSHHGLGHISVALNNHSSSPAPAVSLSKQIVTLIRRRVRAGRSAA